MRRVLIAGCGRLGTALGSRLRSLGADVWGLRRGAAPLPDGMVLLRGDLAARDGIPKLPDDLDAVIYTAAADAGDEAAYRRAYCEGPQNLIRAMARRSIVPGRFLFVSSSAVYGQQDGEWVDEESVTEPRSFRGRILLEGERKVQTAPCPTVIARLTGIYGPSRTWLLDAVRAGRAAASGDDPPIYTNRIHEADAAGMLVHLTQLDHPQPLYLGVDDEPAPRSEVVRWLAEQLGVTLPDGPAPERRRDGNKRCSNARLLRSGYRLRYPTWREGYGAMLA